MQTELYVIQSHCLQSLPYSHAKRPTVVFCQLQTMLSTTMATVADWLVFPDSNITFMCHI